MPKPSKTRGEEKVASVGDLEWPEVTAILQTMSTDETLVLHKLEIRQKQDGLWRVIVRASRKVRD